MKKRITFVGMDAHKVAIKLAVLLADETKPVEWSVANEKAAVRRMVRKVQRLAGECEVRFCYEEGPCGYALQSSTPTVVALPRAWTGHRQRSPGGDGLPCEQSQALGSQRS